MKSLLKLVMVSFLLSFSVSSFANESKQNNENTELTNQDSTQTVSQETNENKKTYRFKTQKEHKAYR